MSSKKILTFHVYKGAQIVKKAEFNDESVTIGSGSSALLSIPDSGLAELHCVINVEDDGTVHLFDLGSEQGTKINGEAVSNSAIKSGAAIAAGDLKILVTYRAAFSTDDFDDQEATRVQGSPPANATMSGMLDDDKTDPGLKDKAAKKTPAPVQARAAATNEEATDPGPTRTPAPAAARPAATPAPAAKAAAPAAEERDEHDSHDGSDDHPDSDPQGDDLIAILVRGAQADPAMKSKGRVLEVNQIWGDALLEAKQFTRRASTVTIGAAVIYPWRVLGVRLFPVPPPLNNVMGYVPPGLSTCESEWASDFHAPAASLPDGRDFNLVKWKGDRYVVRASKEWDGFVDVGETRYNNFDEAVAAGKGTKDATGYDIPMDDNTRVAVDIDGMVFFTQMVSPGRKAMAQMTNNVDWVFLGLGTIMGSAAFIFFILVYLAPAASQTSDVGVLEDRYVELLMDKPEPEKKKGGSPDAGEGAKAKKEEGKVGKKDAKMEKAKGDKVEMKKQEMDRQIVDQAGIMGAMQDDALASLGASGLSADITGGIGGLIGAKGTQIGSGGLGARGSGIGGGGTAEGLGGLGTKGTGSGSSGFGQGGGNFGQKGEGGIAGVGGDPIVIGALDRSLIDEVIKAHMSQIRYCYQRELTKKPDLGGKIVVKFTIAKDGSVSSASTKSTTMNNPAVEQCIEGRFMKFMFPQPKGGGIVIVSYPFLFAPG